MEIELSFRISKYNRNIDNPYNVIEQVIQIISEKTPSTGDTLLQDATTRDLERLQISNFSEAVK